MSHKARFLFVLFLVLGAVLLSVISPAAAQGILVVNSPGSSGTSGGCDVTDCTLLDAINLSNSTAGVQTIQFSIPGAGAHTILTQISSGFEIQSSVIIDATTQPGYSGKPLIEIRPGGASVAQAIRVESAAPAYDPSVSVTIRGMAFNGFTNGVGLRLNDGQNHLIEQNYFGVDVTGTTAQPNDFGISIRSPNNTIRNNVVSGNEFAGIIISSNADREGINNLITGNFIGTNFNGTAAIPNQDGIQIREGAHDNIIGGTTPADRNIISGNLRWGIFTDGNDSAPTLNTNSTTILGNYIGTNAAGTALMGNGSTGIFIQRSDTNVIGGTTGTTPDGACTGACNLIVGGVNSVGINIYEDAAGTSVGNIVQGNFIGTNLNGTASLGSMGTGIIISSSDNTIGGTTPQARNLISGNITGINIGGTNAFNNVVTGNYIGTNTTGAAAIPNTNGIILNADSHDNIIGGTTPGERNIISGNTGHGVYSWGGSRLQTIEGNFIGTNAAGTGALGNGSTGIFIEVSDDNQIGGTTGTTPGGACTGACNLISGNGIGIRITHGDPNNAEGNIVEGNFIGTNVSGTAPLGNVAQGIFIDSELNLIGGITPEARNLISGNAVGIEIMGFFAAGNDILGNYIGTDTTGLIDLGNAGAGISLGSAAYANLIGNGTDEGANWIGFNNGPGIQINAVTVFGYYADLNRITGNSIFYNGGLGIDLFPLGVGINDSKDPDVGANGRQNYPIITSVVTRADTTINGTLNSLANHDFTVEFFFSTACDPSGYGEGEFFLGGVAVTTDNNGNAAFSVGPIPAIPGWGRVTAVAIDEDSAPNSVTLWNTSEFSQCKSAQANLALTKTDSADPVTPGDPLTYTLTITNPADASYAENVVLNDPLPAGLTFGSAISTQGTCDYTAGTHTVSCDIGQMTNGAAVTVTIDGTVNTGISTATLSNTATVTSDTPDPTPANNTVTQATNVIRANLRLLKADTPDPVVVDSNLTYTLTVTNLGPSTATDISLTDTLPANVTFISATPSQGSCTPGTGTVDCDLGSLNLNASATISIVVRPNIGIQGTNITNTATVSALQADTVPSNNTASATTKVNAPPIPVAPILQSPANNGATNDITPDLTWGTVLHAKTYDVELASDQGFTTVLQSGTVNAPTTVFTPTDLTPNLYFWRVRAVNIVGQAGNWSAVFRFTVDLTPPAIPTLIAPSDTGAVNITRPTLSWGAAADAVSYEVRLDVLSAPVTTVATVSTLSFTPAAPLAENTFYYWQVRAIDWAGNPSAWSDTWEFVIITPTGSMPLRNFFTTGSPTLTWSRLSWAVAYEVEIDDSPTFTSPVYDNDAVPAADPSVTVNPALADGTWYWRVRGQQANGTWGSWSAVDSFVVDAP